MTATKARGGAADVQPPATQAANPPPARERSMLASLHRAMMRLIFPFRTHIPENAVTPDEAVRSFLGTMASTAGRSCATWRQQLEYALADCLGPDARKEFFDIYPVEDYYFAGVIALEAARIRHIFPPEEADELLAEIGDQVDTAAGRGDRVMSDMVFDIIGRIEVSSDPALQKMPYDKVVKAILRHLDIHRNEATRDLMLDKGLRHVLGEPLALGMQNWWQSFHERFVLHILPEPEPDATADFTPSPEVRRTGPRRRPKRAASFI